MRITIILTCVFACSTLIANAEHMGDWEPWETESQKLPEPLPGNSTNFLAFPRTFPQMLAVSVVRFYQVVISPQLVPSCNFSPSCSHYSVQAIQRHGLVMGSLMTLDRLQRCHYWIRHGWYSIAENGLLLDPATDHAICAKDSEWQRR